MANGLFGGGDGSLSSPYMIEDALDLNEIRNHLSQHFMLANDIELNVSPFNEGEGWNPINDFVGSLNGDGFQIKNLFINRPTQDYVGFLGQSTLVDINNLRFENVNIVGRSYVGAFGGNLGVNTTFARNSASGVVNGVNFVAGLAGRLYGTTAKFVQDCYSSTNITATGTISAVLFGQLASLTTRRCLSWGTISAAHSSTRHDVASQSGEFTQVYFINYSAKAGLGTAITESEMKNLLQKDRNFNAEINDKLVWLFRPNKFPQLFVEQFTYSSLPTFLIKKDGNYFTHNNIEWINLGGDLSVINPFLQGIPLEKANEYDFLTEFVGNIEFTIFSKRSLQDSALYLKYFSELDTFEHDFSLEIDYYNLINSQPLPTPALGVVHEWSKDTQVESVGMLIQYNDLIENTLEVQQNMLVLDGHITDLQSQEVSLEIQFLEDIPETVDLIFNRNVQRIQKILSKTSFENDGHTFSREQEFEPFTSLYSTIANDNYKHLIKVDEKYYSYKLGEFYEVAANSFEEFGFTDISFIPSTHWRQLDDNISILTWAKNEDINSLEFEYEIHNYEAASLELTVDEYKPINALDQPISILTYTDNLENPPKLYQQHDYPAVGSRLLKRG